MKGIANGGVLSDSRRKIILDFAKWTTLSALRRAPVRSRADVYRLLDAVEFGLILHPGQPITAEEFDDWHERETHAICDRATGCKLPIGWGVKLINVYLKTAAYVGDLGRPGLRHTLHPPLDAGLWEGFAKEFDGPPEIVAEVCCVRRIKDITDYAIYRRIIAGCRRAASILNCSLIEVEQLWQGSATPETQ